MPSSGHDIVLYSLFEDERALVNYQSHPAHKTVSDWVGSVMENRICVDFNG